MRFAVNALAQHRRRTLLSLLGVVVGVVAVVSLTALGEGARRFVTDQFASLGSDVLMAMPGRNETTGGLPFAGGVPNDLTLEDARSIERQIPDIQRSVPISASTADVSRKQRSRQALVVGSTPGFRRVRDLQMLSGSFLPIVDLERGAPIVVLGQKIARELFEETEPVGQPVRVGGSRMRVIGVLAGRGVQMGLNLDDSVVVPVATGLRLANRASLTRLLLEVRPGADMEAVKEQVIDLLDDRHGEKDVTVITQEAVMSSLSSILQVLTLVVAGIAAISLTVAGIGIMNVMLVSVSERTSEVGLLKALGATRRQILLIFLLEAVLLSLAGGVVGLATGWLAVEVGTAIYPSVPATPPMWAVWAVIGVSFGTGTLFGVLPAWRAARLDPVAALQGGH
ncbi:MAG: peptide ABC transporter permease [Deltaproteobacteria bacterium]|jgi:putative ABC transport system permease protein|nr:peptide ABC transporter permease [Deltaproteobacteria bacterium]